METLSQPVWWPYTAKEADHGASRLTSPHSSVSPTSVRTEEEEDRIGQTSAELSFPELSLMLDEQPLGQASISAEKGRACGQMSATSFQLGPMFKQRFDSPFRDNNSGDVFEDGQTSFCLTDNVSKDTLGANHCGSSATLLCPHHSPHSCPEGGVSAKGLVDPSVHEDLDCSLDPEHLFPGMFDSSSPVSVPDFTDAVPGDTAEMDCTSVPFSVDSASASSMLDAFMLTLPSAQLRGGQCEHESVNPDLLNTDSVTCPMYRSEPVSCSVGGTHLGISALRIDPDIEGLCLDHMLDTDAFSTSHNTTLTGEYGDIWSDAEGLDLIDQAGMSDINSFDPSEFSALENEGCRVSRGIQDSVVGENLWDSVGNSDITTFAKPVAVCERTPLSQIYSDSVCCVVNDPFYDMSDLHSSRHADRLSPDQHLGVNPFSTTVSSALLREGTSETEGVKTNGSLPRQTAISFNSFRSIAPSKPTRTSVSTCTAAQADGRPGEAISAVTAVVHSFDERTIGGKTRHAAEWLKSLKVQQPVFVPYTDCISSDSESETDLDPVSQGRDELSHSRPQRWRNGPSKRSKVAASKRSKAASSKRSKSVASKRPSASHFQSSFLSFIQERPKEDELLHTKPVQFQSSFLDFIEEKKREGGPKPFQKRKGLVRQSVITHLELKRQRTDWAEDCVPEMAKEVDVCTTGPVIDDQTAAPADGNQTTEDHAAEMTVLPAVQDRQLCVSNHLSNGLGSDVNGSQLRYISDSERAEDSEGGECPPLTRNPSSPILPYTHSRGGQYEAEKVNTSKPNPAKPPSTDLSWADCVNQGSRIPLGNVILLITDESGTAQQVILGNNVVPESESTDEHSSSAQSNKALSQCLKSIAIEPCCSEPTSCQFSTALTDGVSMSDHLMMEITQRPDGSDPKQHKQVTETVSEGTDHTYLLNLPTSQEETASSTDQFNQSILEQTIEDPHFENGPVELVQTADSTAGASHSEPVNTAEVGEGAGSDHSALGMSGENFEFDVVEHVLADSEELTESSGISLAKSVPSLLGSHCGPPRDCAEGGGVTLNGSEQADDSFRRGISDFGTQPVSENEGCGTDYLASELTLLSPEAPVGHGPQGPLGIKGLITLQVFDDGNACPGTEDVLQYICNDLTTILPLEQTAETDPFELSSSAVCFSAETPDRVESSGTQHFQTLDTSALDTITADGKESYEYLNNKISENKENCQFLAELVSQNPSLKKMESEASFKRLNPKSSEEIKSQQFEQSNSTSSPESSAHAKPKRLCPCRICGEAFESDGLLRDHITDHKDVDRFVCGLCDHVSSGYYSMVRHMSHHKGEVLTVCDSCGTKMRGEVPIKHHRLTCVTESLTRICTTCSAVFTSFQDFSNHWRQTHKTQP